MRTLLTILAASLLCSSLSAEPRKHWYKDPKWWVGEVVILAALTADCHSTAYVRGPGIVETNRLLGPNPSNRRIVLYGLSGAALQTTLHASAWHVIHHEPIKSSCQEWYGSGHKVTRCTEYGQDNWFWRDLAYTSVPTVMVLTSGRSAARNYQLQ